MSEILEGTSYRVDLICSPSPQKNGVGLMVGTRPNVSKRSGGPANFGGIYRLYLNCAISRKLRQKLREITDV